MNEIQTSLAYFIAMALVLCTCIWMICENFRSLTKCSSSKKNVWVDFAAVLKAEKPNVILVLWGDNKTDPFVAQAFRQLKRGFALLFQRAYSSVCVSSCETTADAARGDFVIVVRIEINDGFNVSIEIRKEHKLICEISNVYFSGDEMSSLTLDLIKLKFSEVITSIASFKS